MSKKDLALQQALDQITTSFGKGSIMWLGRSVSAKNIPVVSTGSFSLDLALGVGGLPKVCHLLFCHLNSAVCKTESFQMYTILSEYMEKLCGAKAFSWLTGYWSVYYILQGRVVEIYGPEASGKTTLALHVIAEAQKQGG